MKLFFLLLFATAWAKPAPFSEEDLNRVLAQARAKKRHVVFYTWSPNMVLSQKGSKELSAAPFPKNTDVVVLLDPDADPKLAQRLIRKNQWPESYARPVNSKSLLQKGIRVHYPSYVFAKHGQKLGTIVPGYKTTNQLEQLSKRYLR